MSLKVFVRNKAIAIYVHISKHIEELRLAVESFVFDLNEERPETFGTIIIDVGLRSYRGAKILISDDRGWVSSNSCSQSGGQFVRVSLVDDGGN